MTKSGIRAELAGRVRGLCFAGLHANVHLLRCTPALKGDPTVLQSKERVIGADANIGSSSHARAALAHNDVASQHLLATEGLYAQPLAVGIAPVTGTTACFLVCHGIKPALLSGHADRGD